jgi:hypothetical protein
MRRGTFFGRGAFAGHKQYYDRNSPDATGALAYTKSATTTDSDVMFQFVNDQPKLAGNGKVLAACFF